MKKAGCSRTQSLFRRPEMKTGGARFAPCRHALEMATPTHVAGRTLSESGSKVVTSFYILL